MSLPFYGQRMLKINSQISNSFIRSFCKSVGKLWNLPLRRGLSPIRFANIVGTGFFNSLHKRPFLERVVFFVCIQKIPSADFVMDSNDVTLVSLNNNVFLHMRTTNCHLLWDALVISTTKVYKMGGQLARYLGLYGSRVRYRNTFLLFCKIWKFSGTSGLQKGNRFYRDLALPKGQVLPRMST